MQVWRPRVGVSTCLLGQQVRYDGGHKHDRWITGVLSQHVELIDVCPEVEIGLGTPREPIRLERIDGEVRLVGQTSKDDHTEAMLEFSRRRVEELGRLDAYLLKAKSPSCGPNRIPIWNPSGQPERSGRGLFAGTLTQMRPELAIEEEGRLNDTPLRERFLAHLYTVARLRELTERGATRGNLQAFHRAHKFLLMSYSPKIYRELGRLVAEATDAREAARVYGMRLAEAFQQPASMGRQVNTLQHAAGMLRDRLTDPEREELVELIGRYSRASLPLVAVTTLLRSHARRHQGWRPADWLAEQTYLEPYPPELAEF
ncbi:MAG: YbgA family protein [Actinomycetota bacterium]